MSYGPWGAMYNGSRRDPNAGGGALSSVLLRRLDFRTQPTVVFADGAVNPLFGLNWTGRSTANAATFQNTVGVGMQFVASAANTAFTSSGRTAARIFIELSTLIPEWEPWWVTFVEAYWTLLTLPVNTNRVFCGYATDPASPVNRVLGGGIRANAVPVHEAYAQADTSIQGFTNDPADDASAVRIAENSCLAVSGLYDAGDDAFPVPYTTQGGIVEHAAGPGGVQQPVNAQNNPGGLHVAFPTGTTLGTMAATLALIQISRVA